MPAAHDRLTSLSQADRLSDHSAREANPARGGARSDVQPRVTTYRGDMDQFPYITEYINDLFRKEKARLDYRILRPILLVMYFFLRTIVFPIKFVLHRRPWGFEATVIDAVLAFGLKYLASEDAAELLIRHVQIEPLIYRHIVAYADAGEEPDSPYPAGPMSGIDGSFDIDSLKEMIRNHMTVSHDELAYEIGDRFDRQRFLDSLEEIKARQLDDHDAYGKGVLDINRKHSIGVLGATNVVMMIVIMITIFGDLRTSVKALNSFDSDSIVLWAMKHIYRHDPDVMTDLDFYMQVYSNRSHYNSSVFFSDPSQYLYYHIVFDEFVYETLRTRPPAHAA